MKKLLSCLLVFSILMSLTACSSGSEDLMADVKPSLSLPEYTPSEEAAAATDFAIRLFRETYEKEANTLISPLSVLCALSMTANGAKNETLEQMEQVLGLDVQTLNQWLKSYMAALPEDGGKVSLANAIWFKDTPTLTVEESFLQTNADYYGAGIYKAAFDASTKNDINRWVEKHTDGMIKDILDEIPEEAVMYLVNALAFDARWQEIYEKNQIREGTFTTENGAEVTVDMMHSTEHLYLEDDMATGFIKYYEGEKYAFAALLPNDGMKITIEEYLTSLTGARLHELLCSAQYETVEVAMPKFEIEYDVEMSEILKSMGMTDAFDGTRADFSGLGTSTEGIIHINRVLHKTFICVDGKGTQAGAATVVEMVAEGAMEPSGYVVNLDRPFVYMLIDCEQNLPFFIGAMMDPTGAFAQGEEPVLERAPDLTVTAGGDSYVVSSGNYSWTAPGPNGEMMAVIACGAHPLADIQDEKFRVVSENSLQLSFPVEPDELTVTRWPRSPKGSFEAAGETIETEGLTLTVEKGEWVYEIKATWNRDTWGGEAGYFLYISR